MAAVDEGGLHPYVEIAGDARRAADETNDHFEIACRAQGDGDAALGKALVDFGAPGQAVELYERCVAEIEAAGGDDPELERPEHGAAREALGRRWAERLSLARIG